MSPYPLDINLTVIIEEMIAFKSGTRVMSQSKSMTYTVIIPSILIGTRHKKGDKIQYTVPGAGYVSSGVIMENDMIKFKKSDDSEDIFAIHASNVYRDVIDGEIVVDITDRPKAETDLILKTENMDKKNIYHAIRHGVCWNLCMYSLEMWTPESNYYDPDDTEWMTHCIAINIYALLYSPEYEYQVQCLFDSKWLFYEKQWRYLIIKNYNSVKRGITTNEIQNLEAIDNASICNICRCIRIGVNICIIVI